MSKIIIDNLSTVSITEVGEVIGFDDKIVEFKIKDNLSIIYGKNLKITKFDKTETQLEVIGEIERLNFNHKKESFFKKLLK